MLEPMLKVPMLKVPMLKVPLAYARGSDSRPECNTVRNRAARVSKR